MSRLLVVAVLSLAALAAADALRDTASSEPPAPRAAEPRQRATLVRAPALPYTTDGPYLKKRVLYAGREYLSAEAVEEAFPVEVEGPLDISRMSVAPDGTVVLAVYRFPLHGPARGAIELWHRRRLVAAFPVPTGYFGGGVAVSRDARYVATFSYDGQIRGIYDRTGRPLSELPESFLYVE
jgi:hypothetical protein